MRRNDATPLHLNVSIVCMMLLVMVLSIACASAPADLHLYSEEESAKAQDAIRLLLERASTAAPENMFVTKADISHLGAYIPQTAQGLLDVLDIIPGLKTECQKWLDSVYPICSSISLAIPERLAETIATMQIPNPQVIVRGGTTSSTSLLDSVCSNQLEQELRQTLQQRFSEKAEGSQSVNELWARIVNKYNIWRIAQLNLAQYSGKVVPKEIGGDTAEYLARLISDMFFTQMAIEEDAIRTTPKPQDNSLIAEVFGTKAQ